MKIKFIEGKNFRSYGHLKVNLDNYQGLTLLSSINGKGKSSIYFTLLYALYGKCPDGTKADEVIKHGSTGGTYAKAAFEIYGKEYEVTRYRKDKEYKNKVILVCNGEDITLATDKATNEKIISILGFNEETLLNSLVFSPEQLNSFINATDKGKKALLEDLTNTAVYRKAQALIKDDLKIARDNLSKAQEEEKHIIDLHSYQTALESQYEANKAMYVKQQEEFETYLQETDLEALIKQEETTTNTINQINQNLVECNRQIDQVKVNSTPKHLAAYNEANQLANQYDHQIKDTKDKLQDLFNHLKEVQVTPNPICSMCGNVLDEEHKAKEINTLTDQLQKGKQIYQDLTIKKEAARKQANQLSRVVKEEETKINSRLEQVKMLTLSKDKLNQELNQATNKLNQAKQGQNTYQETKDKLAKLKITKVEKPKELSIDYKEELTKQQDLVRDNQAKVDQLVTLQSVYSDQGVKAQALNQVVPFLNDHLAQALEILAKGKLQAKISSQTTTKTGKVNNKIDLLVTTPTTKKNYQELSSGEKRRVGIALNIAFMQYLQTQIGGTNLVVLDELFDNLDQEGIDGVIELLAKLNQANTALLVISHNPDLKYNDNFDNLINLDDVNNELIL